MVCNHAENVMTAWALGAEDKATILTKFLAEYTIHYNTRRPHQSLDQRYPDADMAIPTPVIDLSGRQIKRRPILGGLINEYEAA